MSNATVTMSTPLMRMFWKANASDPPSVWAVRVRVRVEPVPVSGVVKVARSLVRTVDPISIGSFNVNDAPPSRV